MAAGLGADGDRIRHGDRGLEVGDERGPEAIGRILAARRIVVPDGGELDRPSSLKASAQKLAW
jgi:hypothetical protein